MVPEHLKDRDVKWVLIDPLNKFGFCWAGLPSLIRWYWS